MQLLPEGTVGVQLEYLDVAWDGIHLVYPIHHCLALLAHSEIAVVAELSDVFLHSGCLVVAELVEYFIDVGDEFDGVGGE